MTEHVQPEAPSIPDRFPVDILHVSDLHFYREDAKHEACWQSFINHVSDCVRQKQFKPEIIAFTGDLVETPWPFGRQAFRRGVNALLELASICRFLPEGEVIPIWKEDQKVPPDAWWKLLYNRIFIVPGNHDFYLKGLRVLWNRSADWLAVARKNADQGPPIAKVAGPLAIRLLDSNGESALFSLATGRVLRQETLDWPSDLDLTHRFRVALIHGHPVQLPFLLEGMDSEAFMVLENAGLLLKNLGNLGVRLVLHGHRHYPGVCSLSFPESNGTSAQMIVVGAGSVTKLPKSWRKYAYNWIRIYPDHRVEITLMSRGPEVNQFEISRSLIADRGDFSYDSVVRTVRVIPETGDVEVSVKVFGFRVAPGRPPVSRIPFELGQASPSSLGAFHCQVMNGVGVIPTNLKWNPGQTFLEVIPAHRSDVPPLDFELRYYAHNAMALTEWEAAEMYGSQEALCESIDHRTLCETGRLILNVRLPQDYVPQEPEPRFWVHIKPWWGGNDVSSDAGNREPNWDSRKRHLSIIWNYPNANLRYSLNWRLPSLPKLKLSDRAKKSLDNLLRTLDRWKRGVLQRHHAGCRDLDGLCQAIAGSLVPLGLEDSEVSLFIGEVANLRKGYGEEALKKAGRLCLVGSNAALADPPSRWSLPFGAGVAGRAFRTGTPMVYNVPEAEETLQDYGKSSGTWPRNYYYRHEGEQEFQALLAAPVFPVSIGREFGIDVRSAPFTLAVLCIGSRDEASPLVHMAPDEMDELVRKVVLQVEERIYVLAKPPQEP